MVVGGKYAVKRHSAVLDVAVLACMAALGAVPPPDAAALNAAREDVRTLLADDFADLNAGRRTLVDVAAHVAELADTADSAAKVRVLQEGAFNIYREAGALNRAAERHVPFWINLGTDTEFAFAACPAGSFMMGYEGDPASPHFRHKVKLPRPFWIARFQTTKRLYDTFRRITSSSKDIEAHGGMDVPHGGLSRKEMDDFCAFLTYRNKDRIPKGYVFRLPTDAEWEYALNTNCSDANDPYTRFRNGDKSVLAEIAVSCKQVNEVRAKHGLAPVVDGQGLVFAVGTRRPNAWGIYDMLGNGQEYVLDTIPRDAVQLPYGEGVLGTAYNLGYSDEETEPVRHVDDPNALVLTRGGMRFRRFGASWYDRTVVSPKTHYNRHFVFRVALAPDILGERRKESGK